MAHPIIGDATHGKGPINRWWAERLGQQRLWLHAWRLAVPHPETGAALVFDSGLQWPARGSPTAVTANAVQTNNGMAAPTADWQRLLARLPWQASSGAH
jgi:tRNA pseudouridine65 synthase